MPWSFEIVVDPAAIGTAQQKRYDPRSRRFFTPAKVARGIRAVALAAKAAARRDAPSLPPPGSPVALSLAFLYAVPKSRLRSARTRPAEGSPCTARWAGDCDNRAKAVVDALALAGLFPDDQFVTRLAVRKAWTLGVPRIAVSVRPDGEDGQV